MKRPKARVLLCILLCLSLVSADALPLFAGSQAQAPISANLMNSTANNGVNGEYVVSVSADGQWQEAGRIGYNMFLKEKSLDLSGYLAENSPAAVRIVQEGGESAHLDSVFLGGETPQSVDYDNGILLQKLSKKDLDLTNVAPEGIELVFPANRSNDILSVTGRIEGKWISREPFKFPSENNFTEISRYSRFYSYKLESVSKSLAIDGNLDEIEGLDPFFKVHCSPGTGHPEGYTYGWIMNDEDYLYAVVDFTSDNTMDGEKDYSKLYAKTDEGIKEFKVSVPETAWGQPAFTYTDKVAYQHKVYEFKIPIGEIVEAGSGIAELAFSAYGTSAISKIQPSVAYSSADDKYLLAYEGNGGRTLYGRFVNSDDASYDGDSFIIGQPPVNEWIYNYNPEVVYDSKNKQFLVVWKSCDGGGKGYIKGRLIEYGEDSKPVYGDIFNISELEGGLSYATEAPSATYSFEADKFLVTWTDYVNNSKMLYGRLIESDADLVGGSNLIICSTNNADASVSVSGGSDSSFLAVYIDYDVNYKACVYTRSVTSAGVLGNSKLIHESENMLASPYICFNEANGKYLATWSEDSFAVIHGQYLDAAGNKSGSLMELIKHPEGDPYLHTSMIYNSQSDSYLSVWNEMNDKERLISFGQLFNGSLNKQGNAISIGEGHDFAEYIDSAANTNAGNFLAAYSCTGDEDQVYVELIGEGAERITKVADRIHPALAYNPQNNKYVMVYSTDIPEFYALQQEEPAVPSAIMSRVVDNNGIEAPYYYQISDDYKGFYNNLRTHPNIAYGDGVFLAVWYENWHEYCEVRGVILNADGKPLTEDFSIGGCSFNYNRPPAVAFAESDDPDTPGNFVVTWTENQYWNDLEAIVGLTVQYDPENFDPNDFVKTSICEVKGSKGNPYICYSEETGKFLVVWSDDRDANMDVYGRLLNNDGTLYAKEGEISIADGQGDQLLPAVVYNGTENYNGYAIVWRDDQGGINDDTIRGNYLNYINDNGGFAIDPQDEKPIIADDDKEYSDLGIAYNRKGESGKFLLTWSESIAEDGSSAIWGGRQQLLNDLVLLGQKKTFGYILYPGDTEDTLIYNRNYPILDAEANLDNGSFIVAFPTIEDIDDYVDMNNIRIELVDEATPAGPGKLQFKATGENAAEYRADEGGVVALVVERVEGDSGPAAVKYRVKEDSTAAADDYSFTVATINFADKDTTPKSITINLKDDQYDEVEEFISLELYEFTGAGPGKITIAKVYINDTDIPQVPYFSFTEPSYTVAEDVYAAGIGSFKEITVKYTEPYYLEPVSLIDADQTVVASVYYKTSDGTAKMGDKDYESAEGVLIFTDEDFEEEKGCFINSFRVPILDDTADEPNENVILTLSGPSEGAVINSPNPVTLTIIDDDEKVTPPNNPPSKDKDKKSTSAAVPAPVIETPPPTEGLPNDALVGRMPGYITLSTPAKINEVKNEITLNYNKATLDSNPSQDARIYYWQPEVKKWVALATYPDGDGKVKAINDGGYKGWFVVFGVIQPHFSDVSTSWAEQLINRMNGLGLVEGYDVKGSDLRAAKPEQKVTRAEFTMFVTRIMNMNPDNILLPDIPDSEVESILSQDYTDAASIAPWVREAVAKATKAGLVPFEGSSFKPLEPITRIEAGVMVSRALKKFKDFKPIDLTSFKDSGDIPGWAVGEVVENALEGYTDNTLKPNADIARAESLAMLLRLFIKGLGW